MSNVEKVRNRVFKLICLFAELRDEEQLRYLITDSQVKHIALDLLHALNYRSLNTPLLYLACNNKQDAVNFLIERFDLDASAAAEGYARIGEDQQVHDLLQWNANLGSIIRGYAYAGTIERVEAILHARPDLLSYAMMGYALTGNVEQVNNILARGGFKVFAVNSYIDGGHLEEAEKLIVALHPKRGFAFISQGYYKFIYSRDADQLLFLLSSTNDVTLRSLIANNAKELSSPLPTIDAILDKSIKINHFMREYHLKFEQAKTLLQKGVLIWLLQGQQNISRDVFMLITQQLTGMSMQDTQTIVANVCMTTHDQTVSLIEEKYRPSIKARFFGFFGENSLLIETENLKHAALQELETKYVSSTRREP